MNAQSKVKASTPTGEKRMRDLRITLRMCNKYPNVTIIIIQGRIQDLWKGGSDV